MNWNTLMCDLLYLRRPARRGQRHGRWQATGVDFGGMCGLYMHTNMNTKSYDVIAYQCYDMYI